MLMMSVLRWNLPQLVLTMPVLQWHQIAALVEPALADAHDVGLAVAFNDCLGGACPS